MDNKLNIGRYADSEKTFIKENYMQMTDKEIATTLNREIKSVTNMRVRMGLIAPKRKKRAGSKSHREAYLANLKEDERRTFFEKEVRSSARYRALLHSLNGEDLEYYVEKWVEFMLDPTVETMTSAEKDALHTMILSEIRINQYMAMEKKSSDNAKDGQVPISKGKEIKEMQEIILKCQQNLNVERRQRLKNQNDQSMTFTNLIKDLKNPSARIRAGKEAAMLKYIGEATYNLMADDKKILSGINLFNNFKEKNDAIIPSGHFLKTIEETLQE